MFDVMGAKVVSASFSLRVRVLTYSFLNGNDRDGVYCEDFVDNASVVKCPCFNYMNNETFEKYYLWVVLSCFNITPTAVLIQMWYCYDTISCNS